MGYCLEIVIEPLTIDDTYEKWSMDNAIAKSWLVGAIETLHFELIYSSSNNQKYLRHGVSNIIRWGLINH